MSFRSLRAANRGLYLGTTLLVLAACACALLQGERPEWQQWLAAAAALATLCWGGYYSLLRYQVDALGLSRHSFFLTRERILWEELAEVSFEEQESMGTAHCALHFCTKDGRRLTLSSDLLTPDELHELADELRQQGLLPARAEESSEPRNNT